MDCVAIWVVFAYELWIGRFCAAPRSSGCLFESGAFSALIAQLAERETFNLVALGSIPNEGAFSGSAILFHTRPFFVFAAGRMLVCDAVSIIHRTGGTGGGTDGAHTPGE